MSKITPIRNGVLRGPIERNQKRRDSMANVVTLLGTSADKRSATRIFWESHDPEFFEQLYAGGGIPARIVDLVPEESLRHWVEWINVDKKQQEIINDACEALDVRGALLKSWKWGRAYGGAVCHIVTDTPDPASPLQVGERIIGLRDLSRWDLRILTTDIEYDFGSPNWGQPRIYYLNVQMGSQFKGYPIHWTRMLRFDGQLVPRRTYIRNNYWHDSILNRIYNSIRNYESANDSAAACLMDFNVDVFKMKNLANLLSTGHEQMVKDRIEMLSYSKSVINSMIIDADEEDYENKGRSLQGVAELLVHQANRLVAETDIPHTKLLGESPDGSNATGNSTSQQWYNFIGSEQENYLRPKLKRLLSLMFPNLPQLGFKFKSLRVLDDEEKADLRLKIAQTDSIYIQDGVVDPTEITTSRFGGDEYSMETTLDKEGREAGVIVPGQRPTEGDPDDDGSGGPDDEGGGTDEDKKAAKKPQSKKDAAMYATGINAPEGKRTPQNEPPASEPEPGSTQRPAVEGHGIGDLFSQSGAGESEFEPHNEIDEVPGGKPAVQSFISQTMSEPMRDPRTDPQMKGPGIPNNPRTILPTRGTGIMAPSGAAPEDAGQVSAPRESNVLDSGVEATMKEFAKGTLKSSSGKKVTDPKQAAAIGYSEERGDTPAEQKESEPARRRAATIIVKRGDKFLMGPTNKDGRYTLPGGHVEDNESMHQGAIRELAEETGILAKKLKFLGSRLVESQMGKSTEVAMYEHNLDDETKPTAKHDPDKEVQKWQWFSHKQPLPEDVMGNLKHANNVALDHMGLLK